MSFISYAQNFEDVMLWRALKHVEKGFYIDVGANDPIHDSVTKAFYENGWCGINIEPLSHHHADLVRDRSRDINLRCAAGASAGEVEIWKTDVRGWATADKNVIAEHTSAGHLGTFDRVAMRTLADICTEHSHGEIHFLKIDVEGFEKSVLQGADFSKYRPWIVVIEATKPNSTIEAYADWEPIILNADYQFAYADGLNRFYLAKEHDDLQQQLIYPPNTFDNFIRLQQLNTELHAQAVEAEAKKARERAVTAEAQARKARERAVTAEVQAQQASERSVKAESALIAVHNSSSWRLTAPLRMAIRVISSLSRKPKALKPAIKTQIKLLLAHASLYVNRRPKLRHAVLVVLARFPTLKARLKVAMNRYIAQTTGLAVSTDLANLTLHARQIYADLKDAIEHRQKERN